MQTNRYLPYASGALLLLLIVFPPIVQAAGRPFYVTLATRIMILGIAVSSLNLLIGYGGMVSFGHSAFWGIGGYVVGILALSGIVSAWIAWPLAILLSGLLGLAIGAISLRTKNVYFIMITLAFGQMLFFLFNSLRAYGGQDGMSIDDRSTIAPMIDMENNTVFYYIVLFFLTASLYFLYRLIHSRFGQVLQSIRVNESRMEAIGYPVYRYKLVGFVIAAALAGLAGALNANLNTFIGPNSLSWPVSGQMMIMVILGGAGNLWTGLLGAALYVLLETVIEGFTEFWHFGLGLILLFVVLRVLK